MGGCKLESAEFADLLRATRQFCDVSNAYLYGLPAKTRPSVIEPVHHFVDDLLDLLQEEVDTSVAPEIESYLEHIAIQFERAGALWLAARGYELAAGYAASFQEAADAAQKAVELYGLVMSKPDAERVLVRHTAQAHEAEPLCMRGVSFLQMIGGDLDVARSLSFRVVRQFADSAPQEVGRAVSLLGLIECLIGNTHAATHYSASSARITSNRSVHAASAATMLWLLLSTGQHQPARRVLEHFGDCFWRSLTPTLSWVPFAARIVLDSAEDGVLAGQLAFSRTISRLDSYWNRGVLNVLVAGAHTEMEVSDRVADMLRDGVFDLYMAGVRAHNLPVVSNYLLRVGRGWANPNINGIKDKVALSIVERLVS